MALTGPGRFKGVTIIPQVPGGILRAFSFDAVTDQRETHGGQMMRHPVQRGAEGITDAVRRDSALFSCSGITTDTPATSLLPTVGDRAITAYQLLKDIRAEETPVFVLTSWLPLLDNMWPEIIEGSRGPDTGAAIEISINFGRFRFVTTSLVPSIVDSDVLALGLATMATSF